jgi:ELWxxDGT repeat protein
MKRLPIAFALAALVLAAPAAHAQTPYLVRDVNTIMTTNPGSSSPTNFFRYGARVLYAGLDQYGADNNLWSTDGTAAGTYQVTDPAKGGNPLGPTGFVELNGKVIFNGTDSQHGEELWITDGTAEGTRLLADINPGFRSSSPGGRIVYHGKLYFVANDGLDGFNLWVTDGTATGTQFFKNVLGSSFSSGGSFAILNDVLYFSLGTVWRSDGTPDGTVTFTKSVSAQSLTVAGDHLFFNGYTTDAGQEPWVSDGTEGGTQMLVDIRAGAGRSSMSYPMAPFGDRVLFTATDDQHGSELWISDGTSAGTRLVRDITPGSVSSTGEPAMAILGGKAYFAASTPANGTELWSTDGTEAGTSLVLDLEPGPASSNPAGFYAAGGRFYFAATSGGIRALWVSDGTAGGTHPVKTGGAPLQVQFASNNANARTIISLDGVLLFSGWSPLNGYELWRSDGTDGGTSMVLNARTDGAPSSEPLNVTAAGDWVYFDAWDGSGTVDSQGQGTPRSLWRSDGTPEGTLKLTDLNGTAVPYWPYGHTLFFTKDSKLWMTDGTPEGTHPATTIANRFPPGALIVFILGNTLIARASLYYDSDLYAASLTSDGPAVPLGVTGASTVLNVAGRLLVFGPSIWSTDGTPEGTWTVAPGVSSFAPVLMGGICYFPTNGGLWKTDGTFDGTTLVKSFSGSIGALTPAGRNLFLVLGGKLSVTDGTDAGTQTFAVAPSSALAAVGDRVVFSANDPATGTELWVSDGTAAGTHLLLDIYPGSVPNTTPPYIFSSSPSWFTPAGGLVYFTAGENVHGKELWVTDGTAAGTRLAADVQAGPLDSDPRNYAVAGDRLFFAAWTAATGRELWALSLRTTPGLSIDDIRITEGESATSTARFNVNLSSPASQTVTVDYATADGTATAGSDYDAVSGTLIFSPGQTSKTIDVPVHGDTVTEGNETFSVILRNAAHATLLKPAGFAIIDDDDQVADLSLRLDFSKFNSLNVGVNATNHGPLTATNLKLSTTVTPSTQPAAYCQFSTCSNAPSKIAPNATTAVLGGSSRNSQQYFSVTLTGRQTDPHPADNSIGWTTNIGLSLDAVNLAPGADATAWFLHTKIGTATTTPTTVNVQSSNSGVLTVPATITVPGDTHMTSFPVHAVAAGTAEIQVSNSAGLIASLTVDVIPPGTKVRWPGGIGGYCNQSVSFDRPLPVQVYPAGRVPYTGALATGVVRVMSNGKELGRTTLTNGTEITVPVYALTVGLQTAQLIYDGDANFLPMSLDITLYPDIGVVTTTTSADRSGPNATLHIRVTGSPAASPSGTVTVSEAGVIAPKQVTLTAGPGGIAQADVALTNLAPGTHTLVLAYSGDSRYYANTQNARLLDAHRRAAGH